MNSPKRPAGATTGTSKASATQKADKASSADFSEAIGDREEKPEDKAKKVRNAYGTTRNLGRRTC